MADPENPPATDTAKAIELLRQAVEAGLWVERVTQADLVECFAAAARAIAECDAPDSEENRLRGAAALGDLRAAIARVCKVCKGVLNNG